VCLCIHQIVFAISCLLMSEHFDISFKSHVQGAFILQKIALSTLTLDTLSINGHQTINCQLHERIILLRTRQSHPSTRVLCLCLVSSFVGVFVWCSNARTCANRHLWQVVTEHRRTYEECRQLSPQLVTSIVASTLWVSASVVSPANLTAPHRPARIAPSNIQLPPDFQRLEISRRGNQRVPETSCCDFDCR